MWDSVVRTIGVGSIPCGCIRSLVGGILSLVQYGWDRSLVGGFDLSWVG